MTEREPDAGRQLLASAEIQELLAAAAAEGGGRLLDWQLDHLEDQPGRRSTATYSCTVQWPFGEREELFGASTGAGARSRIDERAVLFTSTGEHPQEVALWLHPNDPDLPGLPRAAFPDQVADLLREHRIADIDPDELGLTMLGYRPRRRAVVRVDLPDGRQLFVKVLRSKVFGPIRERHRLLAAAGLPVPPVLAATEDLLLVLGRVPGRPLAEALFDPRPAISAEALLAVLDRLPGEVSALPRRASWVESVDLYAEILVAADPELAHEVGTVLDPVHRGLGGIEAGTAPTHGDFHEGQLFVTDGAVTGLIDVDTAGPGHRSDDLAVLLGHLHTVQRMDRDQAATVAGLIASWQPVFDEAVDPAELRLRTAAVVLSLATGPHRSQEPDWRAETRRMIATAQHLVAEARRSR